MSSKNTINTGLEPQFRAELFSQVAGIHHASSQAERFYGSRLSQRLDYPLGQCFQNLKKLHGNVKNILSAEFGGDLENRGNAYQPQRDAPIPAPHEEARDIALRYQSLALLSSNPGPELIQYLIATEYRHKRLQAGVLETLGETPLKIAISAQTAMLQVTIDRLDALAGRERHTG